MSASTIVTIMCDHPSCGQWADDGVAETAEIARRQLRRSGWLLAVKDPDYRVRLDYCPTHAGVKR